MPLDAAPDYQGKNFAPVAPLMDARRTSNSPRDNDSSMNAFFREIFQQISTQDDGAWREHLATGRVIGNLINGKLEMKRDPLGSGLVLFTPTTNAARDRSNYPLFPQNSVTLQSKWQKAQIEVAARLQGDGYKAEIQTELINTVTKNYFRDIFTGHYELNEILQAQMFGTYITRYFYDNRLNQLQTIAPIIQNTPRLLMKGYGACKSCGFEGEPNQFAVRGAYPACPECSSYQLSEMMNPVIENAAEIVDYELIKQGDVSGKLLDFPACRYDIRQMAHDSSFFIYRQKVPLRVARELFGTLEISGGDSNDFGMELMESLASRGGSIDGHGASEVNRYASIGQETAEMIEMWLTPEWYTGFRLKTAEKTLAGTIPADVPFEQIFPEGLCVVGFNEMSFQVGVYAEKTSIVSGVYFLQPFSGLGKGLADAVDVARDINELHSMAMAEIKRYGASGIFYDKSTLSLKDVANLFKPNKAVPIDLAKNPHIQRIDQAVGQVSMNHGNNVALGSHLVQLSNLLNMAFLTGDFTQGMVQDVDIDTFGGQQLAHAKAEEQKAAIVTMKVFHREKSAEKILELFRKHIKIPRFYNAGSDRHARTKGKWISGEDLPKDIKFDAVPGSETPFNTFERRMAAQELVEKSGGLLSLSQIAQTDPQMTSWYVSQFGVDLPTLNENELRVVCLSRLENIKELAATFPNPEFILQKLDKPLFVRESGHILKAEFLMSVLDDDEVAEWHPAAREAVQFLIERHYEAEAEAQFRTETIKQKVIMGLAAQQQQFEMAMQQPQIDEQREMADEEQEKQILLEGASRMIDEGSKEDEFERQRMSKDEDFERERMRDGENHSRALELEKIRQANKPKPASQKKK